MQRVTFVRYTAKADRADENEALSRAVFAELRDTAPKHVAYAAFRSGADFVHVFVNTVSEDSTALTELPSFKAFSEAASERQVAPPEILRLDLDMIGAYRLG